MPIEQNIPLAIALVTVGSFCFALSANLQHHAVGRAVDDVEAKARLGFDSLWESIKSPRWIFGLLVMGVSMVLQVIALMHAPVSVVQPVGLLAFPWSMLLQAWSHKRKIPSKVITAVGVTVGATIAFTLASAAFAAPDAEMQVGRVFVGAVVIYQVAFVLGLLGSRGPKAWRCLFWASGGAFFYGLEAALVKSLIEFSKTHNWTSDPAFWIILGALVCGSLAAGWMVQQGYATGPAEVVVASMTITSPVVAVLFGIAILGEGVRYTPVVAAFMGAMGLLAVAGVIVLARLHDDLDLDAVAPGTGVPENVGAEGHHAHRPGSAPHPAAAVTATTPSPWAPPAAGSPDDHLAAGGPANID